jgi:hypothetical protein
VADCTLACGPDIRYASGMSSPRRPSSGVSVILLTAFCAACSSSSGESEEPSPTLVTVAPSTFGEGVLCGDFPGAWKSYVATLTDVTDPARPFVLASSNPVPCSMPVSFSWVIPGNKYVAEIDGYEQGNLVSFGGVSSGSRHVVDPATGQDVKPRWQTACGKETEAGQGEPTTAFLQSNVVVGDCAPLVDSQPGSTKTGITLDLSSTLGSLSCGEGDGQVNRFSVWTEQSPLPTEAACGTVLSFAPVEAGKNYRFRVEAFEAGASAARWATWCEVRAQDGVVLPAMCDPLSSQGALRVDIASILTAAGRSCSDQDIVSYRAVVVGSALTTGDKKCSSPAVFPGLEPSSYQVLVDAFDASGQERVNAFCEGTVEVGLTVDASCQVKVAQ